MPLTSIAPLHRVISSISTAWVRDSGVVAGASATADLETIAARAVERINKFVHLTWTHCHGDCRGFIARITESGEAALFDFDDGGPVTWRTTCRSFCGRGFPSSENYTPCGWLRRRISMGPTDSPERLFKLRMCL